jgi:hypothetical protein
MATIVFKEIQKCEICEMFTYQPDQLVLIDEQDDKYICKNCIEQLYIQAMAKKGK